MLWGRPHRERADLNIDTLWSGGPRVAHAENSGALLGSCAPPCSNGVTTLRPTRLSFAFRARSTRRTSHWGGLPSTSDGSGRGPNYERSLGPSGGHRLGALRDGGKPLRAGSVCFGPGRRLRDALEGTGGRETEPGPRAGKSPSKRSVARGRGHCVVGRQGPRARRPALLGRRAGCCLRPRLSVCALPLVWSWRLRTAWCGKKARASPGGGC